MCGGMPRGKDLRTSGPNPGVLRLCTATTLASPVSGLTSASHGPPLPPSDQYASDTAWTRSPGGQPTEVCGHRLSTAASSTSPLGSYSTDPSHKSAGACG